MTIKKHFPLILFFLSPLFFAITTCSNNDRELSSYNYEDRYKDIALRHHEETGVIVVGYNRSEYFQECIRSIEVTPESDQLTFIFALDGGPQATQNEHIRIIETSSIKKKIILLRNRNYGCPKNHIDSKRFAFEWCKFKKLIILEEDTIVSPYYFTFMLNFYNWATKKYDNIGAVQSWSLCFLSQSQKKEQLNLIRENPDSWNFFTYCMDLMCWQKIRHILYTYEDFIDQIPHSDAYTKARSKPFNWEHIHKIKDWTKNILLNKKESIFTAYSFTSKLALKDYFLSKYFRCSQDDMMGFAFYINDLIKLQSMVNRVIHIGKHGITTTEKIYNKLYERIKLDIFEEDKTLQSFQFIR